MLWLLSVVLVANELTNGRLAIPALAGLLVIYTFNASKVTFIHFLFEWQITCSFYRKNRLNGCQIFGQFGL